MGERNEQIVNQSFNVTDPLKKDYWFLSLEH